MDCKKKKHSKWVDICGNKQELLMESSFIYCEKCRFQTYPIVYKWEENGIKYGILKTPEICNKCGAIMDL